MENYNLDKIRAKLLKPQTTFSDKASFKKNEYFKTEIGKTYYIRILPYRSLLDEPFETIGYYKNLDEKRVIAPVTFGLPDPIRILFEENRKDNWNLAKLLQVQNSYYLVIIDREHEEKGPQIWEVTDEVTNQIFTQMVSKNYQDENIFDPDVGYDWELNCVQAVDKAGKPKVWMKRPCKAHKINPDRKPSKLHKDSTKQQAWLNEMPKLGEMFRKFCKTEKELLELANNFAARYEAGEFNKKTSEDSDPTDVGVEYNKTKKATETTTVTKKSLAKKSNEQSQKETDDFDAQFDNALNNA